ncbi:MAG: serine hydrolase, partial [Bacteroidia bacterium]|nr:serine hydrolase [Bacteroidia bacterium]
FVPSYDNTPNLPATLSPKIVTGLLKQDMGFPGLVITDALDMSGVTNYYSPGEIEVKALLAGNDILLLPQEVSTAISAIRRAIDKSIIPIELIEQKCKDLLRLKFDLGLDMVTPINQSNLSRELNPVSSKVITNKIYKSAVTLVKNDHNLIPLTQFNNTKIASVSIGVTTITPFQKRLDWYAPVTHFQIPKQATSNQLSQLRRKLKAFDLVILGLHKNNLYPAQSFGIPTRVFDFINKLSQSQQTILTIFGNPYILNSLKNANAPDAILVTYQDQPEAEEVAAEVIVGGIGSRGHLPVSTNAFPAGTGIETDKIRLEFVVPEEIGISSNELTSIDTLVMDGMIAQAYPGCQLLFAKEGKVFYNKAFGHPRYTDPRHVKTTDIYDIASLTKVAATTLAIMRLYEQGVVHPDQPLSYYLPELRATNKEQITIREIMTHQAGLEPWIPFYEMTLKDSLYPDPEIYSKTKSSQFPIRVSNHLFMKQAYHDSIFQWIIQSELWPDKEYKYSDLGFYLLVKFVERVTRLPFNTFLEENFYRPLGLTTLGFHPRERFPLSRIMPTEYDTLFRQQVIHGDVHDPGAAMLGGVSGHAGLFSDAFDLAVIFQMLLNDGKYGGNQYFQPSTIQEFTRIQFPEDENRRGMGFDKPLLEYETDGPTCEGVSPLSFGHSGFTGVYLWADPVNDLIYVFLSNRVFPDAKNSKISEMNIRTSIHQQMYEILKK